MIPSLLLHKQTDTSVGFFLVLNLNKKQMTFSPTRDILQRKIFIFILYFSKSYPILLHLWSTPTHPASIMVIIIHQNVKILPCVPINKKNQVKEFLFNLSPLQKNFQTSFIFLSCPKIKNRPHGLSSLIPCQRYSLRKLLSLNCYFKFYPILSTSDSMASSRSGGH